MPTDEEVEAAAKATFFCMNCIMHDHEKEWRKADRLHGVVWRDVARAALTAAERVRSLNADESGDK